MPEETLASINDICLLLKDIVIVVCPVLLAIFSLKQSKKDKETKAYREIKDKYDAKIEKERKERDNSIDASIKNLGTSISEVNNKVASIKFNDIEDQLDKLVKLNGINLEYSQSLSTVVIKIADTIRDTDLTKDQKDDISDAIEKHQAKEKTLTSRMYSFIY